MDLAALVATLKTEFRKLEKSKENTKEYSLYVANSFLMINPVWMYFEQEIGRKIIRSNKNFCKIRPNLTLSDSNIPSSRPHTPNGALGGQGGFFPSENWKHRVLTLKTNNTVSVFHFLLMNIFSTCKLDVLQIFID